MTAIMKKILITGANGYIGKHLVEKAKGRYSVDCLDKNNSTVYDSYLIDIRNNISIDTEYDTVIHLAALVNVSESTKVPADYFETNVQGTLNVLKNIKYNNFIFASTGAAAGMGSPYGISKKMAELVVEEYCNNTNKNYTIFRFYNVIGTNGFPPTNPDGLFYSLMKAEQTGEFFIYGSNYNTPDGTAIRDYVHVDEICESLLKAIDNSANGIENLGHGVGTSVLEIAELYKIVNCCSFNIEFKDRRPGDLDISVLDNVSNYMTQLYTLKDLLKT
jgi:UDP-glucose 4-epimerase